MIAYSKEELQLFRTGVGSLLPVWWREEGETEKVTKQKHTGSLLTRQRRSKLISKSLLVY